MSGPAGATPVTLFYSYAHEDEALRDELQGHLKILERRGLLAPWHDRQIVAGEDWAGRIDENLRRAELVLLLVSKDFIESDYIMGTELGAAMERHTQGANMVVPIVVRAVDLDMDDADALPFLKLQGLPTDLRPVTSWPNRDEAWTNVAKGLRAAVKGIRERRAARVPDAPAAVGATRGGDTPRPPNVAPQMPPQLQPQPPQDFAPAVPAADPVLARILADVVAQLDDAQRARSETPLDAAARRELRDGARTLIDLHDQKRVLWVDDLPAGNRLETAALAKLQIEVVSANSTREALRCVANDGEGFDLVVSDWERPADGPGAGLSLLRALRNLSTTGSTLPFVLYHGSRGATERRQRADQARAAGALGEAVLPSELMALVLRALESN